MNSINNEKIKSKEKLENMEIVYDFELNELEYEDALKKDNNRIGEVDSDGTIRDSNGNRIGEFEKDGTIRDSYGCRKGEIEKDGTVRDSSGCRIGEIESDGTVRDSSGCKIGEASGMSKEQAAYHFFFK